MRGQLVRLIGPEQRAIAKRLIDVAPPGAEVVVREATRSLEQNALMHAMLSDVARARPEGRTHTPDMWKSLFMKACGHAVQFTLGLDGEPFPIGFRSSRLSKSQMADLITFIDQWGTERGVVWTEPRERSPSPTPQHGARA